MFGDLIVAADGSPLRGTLRASSVYKVPAVPSGLDNMRYIVKTEDILGDPTTAPLMDDGPGSFAFYVDADRTRTLLRYSCRKYEDSFLNVRGSRDLR